jgi:hypothetical protein
MGPVERTRGPVGVAARRALLAGGAGADGQCVGRAVAYDER